MNGTKERRVAAIERYVHDLAIALADLPVDEREEVIAGIRDHIDDALADQSDADPEAVAQVLGSLGDPTEIAADARGRSRAATLPPPPPPRAGVPPNPAPAPSTRANDRTGSLLTHELVPVGTMLMFLVVGALIWLNGISGSFLTAMLWVGGLGLLIASPLWKTVEKVVGTLWFGVMPVVGVALVGGYAWSGFERWVFYPYYLHDDQLAMLGIAGFVVTLVLMAWLVSAGAKRAGAAK